ncbi:MAG: class I SAM-dependent methyltransferase [Phycisphaerae bacterium]
MVSGDDRREETSIGRPAAISDHFLFMRKFFKHRRKIASIWPSSRFMARACISQVDFSRARLIVELGSGTGAITQAILSRITPQAQLIAIERDTDFFRVLRERFAGLDGPVQFLQGDVANLSEMLHDCGVRERSVDAVISGLGTPSLPAVARQGIFKAVAWALKPEGVFSNITEIPLYYLPFYRRHFRDVQFEFVPLNIPPGGIYHCRHVDAA